MNAPVALVCDVSPSAICKRISESNGHALGFGLELCGLVLCLLLVFHSWHGKFKTMAKGCEDLFTSYLHSLENVIHYLLFLLCIYFFAVNGCRRRCWS